MDLEKACPSIHQRVLEYDTLVPYSGHSRCSRVSTEFGSEHVVLVDRCMYTGRLCETGPSNDISDLNMIVPVTDLVTGVHFLNAHCAWCNRASHIHPWPARLKCYTTSMPVPIPRFPIPELSSTSTASPAQVRSVKELEAVMSRRRCSIVYTVPPDGRTDCKDMSKIIDTCSPSCDNPELKIKCDTPVFDPVYVGLTLYKNQYCALCNFLELHQYKCGLLPVEFEPPRLGKDSNILSSFSLEILFNFHPSEGLRIGETPECAQGEIYLSEEGICRQKTCPPGYILVNGSCLAYIMNNTMSIYLTVNDSDVFSKVASYFDNTTWLEGTILKALHNDASREMPHAETLFHLQNIFQDQAMINITLFVSQRFDTNSSGFLAHSLDAEKQITTSVVNSRILRELSALEVNLAEISLEIEGLNMFIPPDKKTCVWVIYAKGDYFIDRENSLQVNQTGVLFSEKDYEVLESQNAIVCVQEKNTDLVHSMISSPILGLISLICLSLSILCLLVRLVMQFMIPYFQTKTGKLQFHQALSLCLAYVSIIVSGSLSSHGGELICKVSGICMYAAWLAAFNWMTVMSLDSFLVFQPSASFKKSSTKPKIKISYLLYGWGLPAVITAVVISMDYVDIPDQFKPTFGQRICWFNQSYAMLVYFATIVALSILTVVLLFLLTSCFLCKTLRESKNVSSSTRKKRQQFLIYIRLALLMGTSWSFGILASFVQAEIMWFIFVVLNALQGVALFIAFVCRPTVFNQLRNLGSRQVTTSSKSITTDTNIPRNDINKTVISTEMSEQSIQQPFNIQVSKDNKLIGIPSYSLEHKDLNDKIDNPLAMVGNTTEGKPNTVEGNIHLDSEIALSNVQIILDNEGTGGPPNGEVIVPEDISIYDSLSTRF